VLRLVSTGVQDPGEMTRLMGLDASVIVPATIVSLLQKQLLGQVDRLEIMPLGRQALADQRTRESRSYDMELRHDPYTDTLLWGFDGAELKDPKQVRGMGLHVLPIAAELAQLDVEVRHAEVQHLLDRFGLPFEDRDVPKGQQRTKRDIIRMTANSSYQAWRQAELEVWHNVEREDWDWRLLYGGGENREISAALRALQQDGVEILPLEDRPHEVEVGEVGEAVHRVVEEARPRSKIIQTAEHRAVLREAIEASRSWIIIVSPWLTTAAVDGELTSWLDRALQRHGNLKVVIGYGIEPDRGKNDRKAMDQRDALRRLHQLGNRYRGRLRTVEVGNTHEKLVISDERFAIVTSFNWLSFNPRPDKGMRRETGLRVDEREEAARLRASLMAVLGLK
jgi:PLD-like domain